jgi:hypothetical protein
MALIETYRHTLETNLRPNPHPEADATFARLVAYLNTGGAEAYAVVRALAEGKGCSDDQ